MCILEFSKVPMYEFHYDYSKSNMATNRNNYSQTLISWCMILKLEMFVTIFVRIKKCLVLAIFLVNQNITIIQTHQKKLVGFLLNNLLD